MHKVEGKEMEHLTRVVATEVRAWSGQTVPESAILALQEELPATQVHLSR